MGGGEKYFSAIPYSTYDLPREVLDPRFRSFSGSRVQPVQKGSSI